VCALLVLAACDQPEQAASQLNAKPAVAALDPKLAAQLAHGKELYTRICAVCHGVNGEGYKADAAPALNHPAYLGSVNDVLLRDAIANGRTGSTMSAWSKRRGGPLDEAGIDAVIASEARDRRPRGPRRSHAWWPALRAALRALPRRPRHRGPQRPDR